MNNRYLYWVIAALVGLYLSFPITENFGDKIAVSYAMAITKSEVVRRTPEELEKITKYGQTFYKKEYDTVKQGAIQIVQLVSGCIVAMIGIGLSEFFMVMNKGEEDNTQERAWNEYLASKVGTQPRNSEPANPVSQQRPAPAPAQGAAQEPSNIETSKKEMEQA